MNLMMNQPVYEWNTLHMNLMINHPVYEFELYGFDNESSAYKFADESLCT